VEMKKRTILLAGILIAMLLFETACTINPEPVSPTPVAPEATEPHIASLQPTVGGSRSPLPTSTLTPIPSAESSETMIPSPSITLVKPSFSGLTINEIHMTGLNDGWALAGDGERTYILHTSDGGQTWSDKTPPDQTWIGSMQPDEWLKPQLLGGYFMDSRRAWITTVLVYPEHLPYIITIGQVVLSTQDGGTTWRTSLLPRSQGTGFPQIKFITPERGWIVAYEYAGAGGNHLALYSTDDGGQTWRLVFDKLSSIFSVSEDIGWTADGTGVMSFKHVGFIDIPYVRWTHDGGRNWDEGQELPMPSNPTDSDPSVMSFECWTESPNTFSPSEAKLMVVCRITANASYTYQSYFYSTKDGGESWRSQPVPNGDLMMLNDKVGWIFAREIYRTIDGGTTWAHLKTVAWDGQFNPVDQDHIWAVAWWSDQESALVNSIDGGHTWSFIEPRADP